MHNRLATVAALTLSLIATAASAEGVRTEKNMSLDLATQIAAQTVATCTANGYAVTATVVDRAGTCLLYTSPSPRDRQKSRMPSSA